MPQNGTRHGCSRPFALRRRAIGLSPSRVRYSTHSLISCTVPLPTLPLTYGSAPSSSHKRHELVGAEVVVLLDVAPVRVDHRGRSALGPMPSRQWYSSAKQPPGQRRFGICSARKRLDHVESDAALVRDRRVLADPEAAVDASAQVLGEVAVEVPADRRPR